MIDVTVTYRSCGIEHEPDRAAWWICAGLVD